MHLLIERLVAVGAAALSQLFLVHLCHVLAVRVTARDLKSVLFCQKFVTNFNRQACEVHSKVNKCIRQSIKNCLIYSHQESSA